MMMTKLRRLSFLLPILIALFLVFKGPASGEPRSASPWLDVEHSKIRLISAYDVSYRGRARLIAGVEIILDDGWKTYWRSPGDGLAPSLEWKNSENLQDAELLWPAPKRHESPGGLTSFGYEKRLVLPLLITPGDTSKPIHLKLQVVYGVCADICIPVETGLSLVIPPSGDSAHKETLTAALERVPKRQQRGVYCPHSFITAKRRDANDKPAFLIKTAFEEQATGLDLFAEAPDGLELPAPVKQPRSARGRLYYVIAFDKLSAINELKGQPLTLTMTSDQGSCETVWRMK